MASQVASPVATPIPDYPLDIYTTETLPDDGRPVRGGSLRVPVRAASLREFMPTTQRQDPQVAWSYLDALVRIDPRTSLPAPSLAREWSWSDDGLTLTFALRDNARWHDGTPFTADDAAFTHLAYRDDYRSVVAAQSGLVADVAARDATTLEVRFDAPDGAWLFNVATLPIVQAAQYRPAWEAAPVGERTLEGFTLGDALPVGTGPWRITAIADAGITLARNADYFAEPPHADELRLVAFNGGGAPVDAWRAGELDIVSPVDPQRVEGLLQTEGRLIVTDTPRSLFAVYNFDNPTRVDPGMLGQPEVRQALDLALDRAAYAEEIWGGFLRHDRAGLVAQGWVEGADQRPPRRGAARARKLLEEAGWVDRDGDGVRESQYGDVLRLTAVALETAQPAVLETLAAMQEDLRVIGAALELQVVGRERFVALWSRERTWDLLVYDLRLYPAFAEFDLVGSAWDIRLNADGWNPGGYANAEADAALDAYFAAVAPDAMARALADLNAAIVADPPALWLGHPRELVLVAPEVRGFRPNPLWPTLDTRTAWIAPPDAQATPAR